MSAPQDTSFFGIQEEITLTKNGVWLSNGEAITHPGTVAAFSRNIYRIPSGFEIRLGKGDKQERKTIQVEDTFYFVKSVDGNPIDGYVANLNDGRKVILEPLTLKYTLGRLILLVPHTSEGTMEEAKFLPPAYYEILNHLKKTDDGFSLTIQGKTITFAGTL